MNSRVNIKAMFCVVVLGAALATAVSTAKDGTFLIEQASIDFPIDLLPKELSYLLQDAKGNRTTALLKEGDARYAALKQYLILERHGWKLLRSDVGYIGSGYISTPRFKIICEVDGKGTIIQYEVLSKWTTIGKGGKSACDTLLNGK
jgi:hypothetical protein